MSLIESVIFRTAESGIKNSESSILWAFGPPVNDENRFIFVTDRGIFLQGTSLRAFNGSVIPRFIRGIQVPISHANPSTTLDHPDKPGDDNFRSRKRKVHFPTLSFWILNSDFWILNSCLRKLPYRMIFMDMIKLNHLGAINDSR